MDLMSLDGADDGSDDEAAHDVVTSAPAHMTTQHTVNEDYVGTVHHNLAPTQHLYVGTHLKILR